MGGHPGRGNPVRTHRPSSESRRHGAQGGAAEVKRAQVSEGLAWDPGARTLPAGAVLALLLVRETKEGHEQPRCRGRMG